MARTVKKAVSNVASIESGSKARPETEKISVTASQSGATLEERIRARAYELYQERGYEDGFAELDWLRAEEEALYPRREQGKAGERGRL